MQLPSKCRQPNGEDEENGGCGDYGIRKGRAGEQHVRAATEEGRRRVDLTSKDERRLVAQHVPDHATDRSGDRAHEDDHDGGSANCQGDFCSYHGEDGQPERICDRKRVAGRLHEGGVSERENRGRSDYPQVREVGNPEDGMPIEEKVANGPAAHCRDRRNYEHPEQIHVPPSGSEGTGNSENGSTEEVEAIEDLLWRDVHNKSRGFLRGRPEGR